MPPKRSIVWTILHYWRHAFERRNVPDYIIRLLLFWYTHQTFCIIVSGEIHIR